MTSKKYLDKGGLEHTWAKIKALLNGKADKSQLDNYYSKSEVDEKLFKPKYIEQIYQGIPLARGIGVNAYLPDLEVGGLSIIHIVAELEPETELILGVPATSGNYICIVYKNEFNSSLSYSEPTQVTFFAGQQIFKLYNYEDPRIGNTYVATFVALLYRVK